MLLLLHSSLLIDDCSWFMLSFIHSSEYAHINDQSSVFTFTIHQKNGFMAQLYLDSHRFYKYKVIRIKIFIEIQRLQSILNVKYAAKIEGLTI